MRPSLRLIGTLRHPSTPQTYGKWLAAVLDIALQRLAVTQSAANDMEGREP